MELKKLIQQIAGKRVTVIPLGHFPQGTGIESAKFFIRQGAKVTATDLASASKRREQKKELMAYYERLAKNGKHVFRPRFVFGHHDMSDILNADLIVHGPSMPAHSPYLTRAAKLGIPVTNDWGIFFALKENTVLAVTGTRGKSTTTALLYQMLKKVDRRTCLTGNIGISPLHFIQSLKPDVPIAAELSSWLLNHFPAAPTGPHIAVLTNIFPEHLNNYRSMEDYIADKANIFVRQTRKDFAIINRDNTLARAIGKTVAAQRYWVSLKPFKEENGVFIKNGAVVTRSNGKETTLCRISDIALLGTHNQYNVMASALAAWLYGVPIPKIQSAIRMFKGLPGRLELVRTLHGVRYYNDTTATSPHGVIAALDALGANHSKKIILICGGMDKELEYAGMAKAIKKYCKAVVLLPGTATDKLTKHLSKLRVPCADLFLSMAAAVNKAYRLISPGDIVILSPAGASFNLFHDEFERGDVFVKLVRGLS